MNAQSSRRTVQPLALIFAALLVSVGLLVIACGGSPTNKAVGVNLTPTPLPDSIGSCKIARDTQCPGADLSGADLGDTYVGRDRIRKGADLKGSNFEGANFSNAKLGGIVLEGANLKNANFANAYVVSAFLYQADLSGANLTGADFSDADIDEAKTDGVIFCNTKWVDRAVRNDNCP
jgi:uncharacterized protein YjbI with pentapeptide repeats